MSLSDFLNKSVLACFRRNREFFQLLNDFKDQLPPKQKKAKEGSDVNGFSTLDTSDMKTNLSDKDIDLFQKKLENFPYHRIWFRRKSIKIYSSNLQRILQSSNWTKFNIAIIQNILENEENRLPYLFGARIGKYIGY